MNKDLFQKYWKLKTAYSHSAISRINPNELTPVMKLTLARARIWGDNIGGNLRTGHRHFKGKLKGPAMADDFAYSERDFYLPWKTPKPEFETHLDEQRQARKDRKGVPEITQPSVKYEKVPQYERIKFMRQEYRRKTRLGLPAKFGDKT